MADFPVSIDDLAPASVERSYRFEVLLTVLLACTALVGAYAAYRADLDSGDALRQFQVANKTNAEANDLLGRAASAQSLDQQIFVQFAKASNAGKTELANSLRDDLSPTLKKALIAWGNEEKYSPSPFVGGQYEQPLYAEGEARLEQAQRDFAAADELRETSDRFTLITVFLASALFLFGIASVTRNRSVRLGMTGVGIVIFLGAFGALLANA